MKTTITALIFTVLLVTGAFNFSNAQSYNINLYSGYVFDDGIEAVTDNYNYLNGTIKGGYQFGAGFEYIVKPTYGLELAYFGQATTFPITFTTLNVSDSALTPAPELNISFIMLGGNKYLPVKSKVVFPYGGLMLGMAIFSNNSNSQYVDATTTKFAWGGRVGANFMFSPNVGLKLHAQLLSAVQSIDGGAYIGTGGVGAGLSSNSSMYQFGLGGALVISFGNTSSKTKRRM